MDLWSFLSHSFDPPYLSGCSQQKDSTQSIRRLNTSDAGMLKTGSPALCLNCLPSKQQERGLVSVALEQAAHPGRQHHKFTLRVELSNRLQFSQEVRVRWKTKTLLVMVL
ncbi:hypothetical protein XENOCAPTIV_003257 [Xenoophorus captivus]|uniref:Uncharacterized protein n=1 Tax=Xenoophorus captivus TaxID=1517983 RepID=A0ABV0QZP8_9TELE